jgi:hypothetical protein
MTTTVPTFVQNANKEEETNDFLHYHPQNTFQLKNVFRLHHYNAALLTQCSSHHNFIYVKFMVPLQVCGFHQSFHAGQTLIYFKTIHNCNHNAHKMHYHYHSPKAKQEKP